MNVERIEQIAIPVTFMYYPPTAGKNKYFLMSDNQVILIHLTEIKVHFNKL